MKFHYYVFSILLLSSLLLIGGSFTGKVTSQSCCFPPDCPEEYLCHIENPTPIDNAEQTTATVLGIAVLVGSVVMINLQHGYKRRHP